MHTLEDFDEFQACVRHWIGALGLYDWVVDIRFDPLDDETTVKARCLTNWTQHSAAIVLNSSWRTGSKSSTVAVESMERVALHEVLHLAICELVNLSAQQRDAYCDPVDAAEHALLRRLMRALPPAMAPAQP